MLLFGPGGPHEDAMVPEEEVMLTATVAEPQLSPNDSWSSPNDDSSMVGILSENSSAREVCADLNNHPRGLLLGNTPSGPLLGNTTSIDRELLQPHAYESIQNQGDPMFNDANANDVSSGLGPPSCVVPDVGPSVSRRHVLRRPGGLLRAKNVDELEEKAVYEEEDRTSNVTRRQIYTRSVKPRSLWNQHEHFRRWVYSIFSTLCLGFALVAGYQGFSSLKESIQNTHMDGYDDLLRESKYAQKQFELNLCNLGPPVDLMDKCKDLDNLRNRIPERLSPVISVARLVRSFISVLVGEVNYVVMVGTFVSFLFLYRILIK